MRSLQGKLPEFTARGVKVVALSVDPPEVTKGLASKQGYSFLFLCDPKAEVIRRYDLLHEGGARGSDIARPAEFLIDETGIGPWRNRTQDDKVRDGAEQNGGGERGGGG
mgnify:CR=1 FL=1